jgi:predicted peroxiredoxin
MKIILFLIPTFLVLISCQSTPKITEKPRDGVFIHISSGPEDAHKVLMPLKMAEIMVMDKDVLIYFDIKGVYVVLNDTLNVHHDGFTSSKEQLKLLIEKGVTIMACPTCLKVTGKTPEDLMSGVVVANKDKFFSFTEGRILTLDY